MVNVSFSTPSEMDPRILQLWKLNNVSINASSQLQNPSRRLDVLVLQEW